MLEKENDVLVSVIMPNFNGSKYIDESMQSVLGQTIPSLELIVIDDGSLDESREIIERVQRHDGRVIFISSEGGLGPAKARNAALDIARGRYIAFLDSDDYWFEDKLKVQLSMMNRTRAGVSCTAMHVVDENSNVVGERTPLEKFIYSDLIRSTIITSSVIVDRTVVGHFKMPDISRRQDLALWLSLCRRVGEIVGVNEVLGAYRVHGDSYSRNKFISAYYTWKVIREVEKIPPVRAAYYFTLYALKGLKGRFKGLN
ncbi:glycosyltransferase [Pseudidiomarina sp. 1APP75-32.1]|uniref:Glycosyltransferase n=1 Tax=Pseudidiomarina terrestris TaxID=2820060 RepID=A0AAW7R142_9GAMM|nr:MULTISPECIES: glycosyltransferase [unclassified Pseudidiomarina]MDN7124516.1 glycosyltransferase [Pseudidiomarina sp. 1APP75-32.1]MDN7129193.1 glycosyltransferase [Pseudidiomarina sp. 1APR75-15]